MKQFSRYFPHILLAVFLIIWASLAFTPVDRTIWLMENAFSLPVLLFFVVTYPNFRFSNLAYFLIFIWLVLNTIGAYYTFDEVPFDFVNRHFASGRNYFDRLAHFAVGLYAYPFAEFVWRKQYATWKATLLFSLFFIIALAGVYEIVEWLIADFMGETGAEFVASQDDLWDPQKDILADTLGAITALILFVNFSSYNQKKSNLAK
jgi:putative membrane protein